jgi:hypothetical protein
VIFVEPFCGTAAVTLRLLGGNDARPPVTYMGAKSRYAEAILSAMGLRSGQGADEVVLVDTGPWARAWSVLRHPGAALEVAGYIANLRGAGAELFEHLRRVGQPADPVAWTGNFLALQNSSARGIPVQALPDGTWKTNGYAHVSKSGASRGFCERLRPHLLAARVARLDRIRWPRTRIYQASALEVVSTLEATHAYLAPPYQGTTGYGGEGLAEGELRYLCHVLADRGALVAVSEGRPLGWPGWHSVDLTPCGKRGQVRTFTKSREEHLLMNQPPAARPAVQLELLA